MEVARKCVDLKIGEKSHIGRSCFPHRVIWLFSHRVISLGRQLDRTSSLFGSASSGWVGNFSPYKSLSFHRTIFITSSFQVWFRLLPSGGRSLHMACAHCRDRSCCFFSQVSQTLVSHRTKTKLTDSPDTVNAALVRFFDQVSWGTWLLQRAPASFAKDFLLKW